MVEKNKKNASSVRMYHKFLLYLRSKWYVHNFKDMKLFVKIFVGCCILGTAMVGCGPKSSLNGKVSNKTGWAYNNPDQGFFNVKTFYEGKRPYGMVYVPENTFVKGQNSENLSMPNNNNKKRVAATGFFMDEHETTNLEWREYVAWLQAVYSHDPRTVILALPDETVWRSELAYNDPFEQNYYTHVAFNYYPVVGVSWEQANNYCKWRTDRMNELVLLQSGVIEFVPLGDVNANVQSNPEEDYLYFFTTTRARDYVDANRTEEEDLLSTTELLNGLLFDTEVRLPTEIEWEYAAYGQEFLDGSYQENNTYPWSGGQQVRSFGEKATNGKFNANFTRGRGDLIGIALNNTYTVPVNYFQPNGYGLYNMAGNVNEWVMDVYRATVDANDEVNTFRGNTYDSDSAYAEAMLIKYFKIGRASCRERV